MYSKDVGRAGWAGIGEDYLVAVGLDAFDVEQVRVHALRREDAELLLARKRLPAQRVRFLATNEAEAAVPGRRLAGPAG